MENNTVKKLLINEKFKEFLSVFSTIVKKENNKQETNLGMSKDLVEKYNSYFEAELYDLCAEMQVNGFKQSEGDKKKLKGRIRDSLINDFSKYSIYKTIYGDFEDEFKIDLILNTNDIRRWRANFEKEFEDAKFNGKLIKAYADKCYKNYIDAWNEVKKSGLMERSALDINNKKIKYNKIEELHLRLIDSAVKRIEPLEKMITYDLKSLEFDDLMYVKKRIIDIKDAAIKFKENKKMNLMSSLSDSYTCIHDINLNIKLIDKQLNSYKQDEKNKTIAQLNLFNNENGVSREIIFKYSTTDVPDKVKDILKQIHYIYYKARNTEDTITRLDLDNKLKDANNAVSKFMSIDKEYRDTLTNIEGKTPYDLMIESLDTIRRDFDVLMVRNNQSLVDDLSVINRKVQAKKSFS